MFKPLSVLAFVFLCVFSIVALVPETTQSAVALSPPITFPTNVKPHAISIDTYGNDSTLWAIVGDLGSDQISVFKDVGNLSFQLVASYSSGLDPYAIRSGDFNNDGDLDFVVAYSTSNTVVIHLNNGNASFDNTRTFVGNGKPISVEVADLDNDGSLDFLVCSELRPDVKLFFGDGFGGVSLETTINVGTSLSSALPRDYDGDGKIDIAVTDYGAGTINFLYNDSNRSFSLTNSVSIGATVSTIASGDINSDGILDIACNLYRPGKTLTLLSTNSGPTDSIGQQFSMGFEATDIELVDLNLDGKLELIAAQGGSSSGGSLTIFEQDSTNSFLLSTISSYDRTNFHVRDLNGDGLPDIYGTGFFTNTFYILLNQSAAVLVQDLVVQSNDIQHVVSQSPTFEFSITSIPNVPLDTFEITVGADTDWTFAEMWNPAPFVSADTFVTYAGAPLVDGSAYYLRLRVHNSLVWSDWFETSFRMNSLPSAPSLVSPDDAAVVGSLSPTLYAQNSSDAEADTITYVFELYEDFNLNTLIEADSTVIEQADSTGWAPLAPLAENSAAYWRVKAFDGFEYSDWSETRLFWVNATNSAPAAFTLDAPSDSTRVYDMLPTFRWQSSGDNDPGDSALYRLSVAIDSGFAFVATVDSLSDTFFIWVDSLDFADEYWWKVEAFDANGAITSPSVNFFPTWVLGDANSDGGANIADVTFLINRIFGGGIGPNPPKAGDINGDCTVNIADVTFMIARIFTGGEAPKIGCAP